MRSSRLIAAVACLFALAHAVTAAAETAAPTIRDYLGPFLDIGVSVRTQTFRVFSPDGPYGEFASTSVLPTLRIGSPMLTWGQGRYGVNVMWDATGLSLRRQTPPGGDWFAGDAEDVGTSIDGYIWYLTPTLNLLGRHPPGSFFDASRMGLGFGVGHIRADGEILLNRPKAGSGGTVENPERRRVDLDQFTPSFSLFAEVMRGPLTFSFGIFGPFILDDYETDVLEFALSASYSWYRSRPAPAVAAE